MSRAKRDLDPMEARTYQKSSDVMTICFGGDNQVSANLFTSFVNNTSGVFEEVLEDICPGARYDLQISAIRPGSFVFDLNTIIAAVPMLMNALTAAGDIVSIYLNLLEIKKFLKGNVPKKVETAGPNITITGNNGTITVPVNVYNIYRDPVVNTRLAAAMEAIAQDGTRDKLVVRHQDREFRADREDFPDMGKPEPFPEVGDRTVVSSSRTDLEVIQPALSGRAQWRLRRETHTVYAQILDTEFTDKVEHREVSFAHGDRIDVLLRVEYLVDETDDPVVDSERYFVEKVYRIIRPNAEPDQLEIPNLGDI